MQKPTIIPHHIVEHGQKFFDQKLLLKSQKIIEIGRINISFSKERENRFIVSGIVNDSEPYQVKIQVQGETLKSNCRCTLWTEEGHCPHAGALFLHYQLSQNYQNAPQSEQLKSHVVFHGHGVHVENYGRIVRGANKLLGATINSTYSSLQYLLTNKKIVNFPLPQDMQGKLHINFLPAEHEEEWQPYSPSFDSYFPMFWYEMDGVEYKKISIFENHYLFNWDNGELYKIPSEISDIIKKIMLSGELHSIHEHIKLVSPQVNLPELEISIDNVSINEIQTTHANLRFSITASKRKGYLDITGELFDEKNRVILPPHVFKTMLSEGGYLNSFRTKSDSYDFLKVMVDSIEHQNQEYKKFSYSSSERAKLIEWTDYFLEADEILFYDPHLKQLFLLGSQMFRELYQAIFTCFGFTAARFSFYLKDMRNFYFQLPKNHLLNGISDFFKRTRGYNIPIFYNNTEVKTWNSNIRFEREKSNMDWFELKLVVSDKDFQIIKNADLGEEVLISNNQLVLLDSKEKELLKFMKKYTKHESSDKELDQDKVQKFSLNFKRARIFELFELKKHGIMGALTPEEEQLCENLLNLKEMPTYEYPDHYTPIAREYQNTGYQWLRFLYENKFGACLADDMGLGKTLQTIMFLESIIDRIDRALIICPVSILLNWKNEIDKFSQLDVEMYYGEDRKLTGDKKIIITSYGIMKKESYTTFSHLNFDILIMDEVQHLKNIRSQGAIAARNLNADFRICLTGTPVENDLSEFYNIMDLSIPGIWGDLSLFRSSSSKKSRLLARQTVRPFILRRTKEQVLTELPEKEENHIYLSFSEEEKEHYLSSLVAIRNRMQNIQQGRKYSEILKSLLQLRQLCLWQKTQLFRSTKIDFLIENLQQLLEEGHKVLVFSQFTTYLDHIQNKVREHSWNFARIDGSQTMKKRQAEVERFQEGDAQVFLISLKAGGVGLNLTAASYIFLMDPWWNPAVESQAIDRAYRIGQENKLTVYRPIIKDSVEEKVLVLQNSKRELFRDLMASDEENFYSGKLSLDDFQQLLT